MRPLSSQVLDAPRELLPKVIAEAQSSGWAVSRDFLAPAEHVRLKREVADLVDDPERHGTAIPIFTAAAGHDRSLTRIERVWDELPILAETDLGQRLVSVAAAYLETDADLFKDKVNVRRPGGPGYPPHQDAAGGWDKYASRFVTIAVILGRSDPRHGGFEVVGDAHRRGRLPQGRDGVPKDAFDRLGPLAVEADAGDLILMDGETPHRSLQNQSDVVSLHLLFTFTPASAAKARDAYYEAMAANRVPLSADGRYTTPLAGDDAKKG